MSVFDDDVVTSYNSFCLMMSVFPDDGFVNYNNFCLLMSFLHLLMIALRVIIT